MTFSINPTAEKTQALFQSLAIKQKGQGAGSAITGNATASAGAAASSTVKEGSAASTVASGAGSVATGTGNFDAATGVCTCAVALAVGAFPAVQAQGLGAFGGMAGALPAALMERSP